ncbi:MAG: methyltransferase [Deltaproteobacteria bacterium]|nr:methyltransferase [Deltaproteobacteria bacterium]
MADGPQYSLSSRKKLTARDLGRFPDATLFHHAARVLCAAECVPRKELYESWEVARRTRRRFRGGRVVDLACGHGLVAWMMLLLDDTSPGALAVDVRVPESARKVEAALVAEWPRLLGRVRYVEGKLGTIALEAGDVVVSAHACGGLTDEVLSLAIAARARVAVLPCCQAEGKGDLGGLSGWMDGALAIDATRAARLLASGFDVHTQTIPEEITPKNRLLLGEARERLAPAQGDVLQGT